ncbi:pectinesterase inhibitor [Phtheirospermum japonicum]|uniref:Pectinesterase inhibitor n=1 Tax=Phtheirospermum japonicum TaxID=374723 RepID=A0A830CX39_9LAMI|nr:pectinesterase inhibitor [Phtheirospermum japonicum]
MSVTSSSTGHKLTDADIKHLCSKTSSSGGCFKVIKSDHRTANVDSKGLFNGLVDKASRKAKNIQSELNTFAKATHDSKLRNEYKLCSEKYNDAIHKLEVAKEKLKSGAYKSVYVPVKDTYEDIKSCQKTLKGASNGHAQILKKNNDLEFLLSIAKAAANDLNKK